jgi:hypothetical protein
VCELAVRETPTTRSVAAKIPRTRVRLSELLVTAINLRPLILLENISSYFSYSKLSGLLSAASVHDTPTNTIRPGCRTVSELIIVGEFSTT